MIDWDTFSKTLGYVGEKEMWGRLYDQDKLSIAQLSQRLGISRNTIRARLQHHEVAVRSRGGVNRVKEGLNDEVVKEAMEKGVAAVAAERGIEYNTLYKKVRKAKGSQSSTNEGQEQDPTNSSTPSEPPDSPEGSGHS